MIKKNFSYFQDTNTQVNKLSFYVVTAWDGQ